MLYYYIIYSNIVYCAISTLYISLTPLTEKALVGRAHKCTPHTLTAVSRSKTDKNVYGAWCNNMLHVCTYVLSHVSWNSGCHSNGSKGTGVVWRVQKEVAPAFIVAASSSSFSHLSLTHPSLASYHDYHPLCMSI